MISSNCDNMANGSTDGLVIRLMQISDYEEVSNFLGHSFQPDEPLNLSLGKDVKLSRNSEHLKTMIKQDYSYVAIDENNDNRIVGILLAESQVPSDVEETQQRAKKSGHILKFLSKAETEAKLFERYKVSKALGIFIICVSANMRGKGLGTRLINTLIPVGRAKGFPLLTAYCTSFYAARLMQAMGMECAYSMPFSDYKDDKGKVVFQPPSPHTHVNVMIARL